MTPRELHQQLSDVAHIMSHHNEPRGSKISQPIVMWKTTLTHLRAHMKGASVLALLYRSVCMCFRTVTIFRFLALFNSLVLGFFYYVNTSPLFHKVNSTSVKSRLKEKKKLLIPLPLIEIMLLCTRKLIIIICLPVHFYYIRLKKFVLNEMICCFTIIHKNNAEFYSTKKKM